MTICREWVLVKHESASRSAKLLVCRSWNCEYCAPNRKRQLMARAASGSPTRFLTLTINPRVGSSPDERAYLLANAWRNCVKRLRRAYPTKPLEYLAIFEAHKSGEPHLHILLRSSYIPQQQISAIMAELIESPIVDIRKIRGTMEAVRYVAKYVTKGNIRFGTAKRYWFSGAYEPESEEPAIAAGAERPRWEVYRDGLRRLLLEWTYEGYIMRSDERGNVIAWLNGSHPPLQPEGREVKT